MKLKLVLESDQWRIMKMPIFSSRHVDFLSSVFFPHQKWNMAREFLSFV